MNRTWILLLFTSVLMQAGHCEPPGDSFKAWQLPSQGPTQMMSYVILSRNEKIIVIDGGRECDAPYLLDFIRARADSVECWFITHVHTDHVDTLTAILKNPGSLTIRKICTSLPEASWIKAHCSQEEIAVYDAFTAALSASGVPLEPLALGQTMDVDGIQIHVLGTCNPELINNALNNSSLVIRLSDSTKSILFPGDLGYEGGEKLLKGPLAAFLPSDYVQMAHHGQNGVGESFYQKVNPKYCLWPTPQWLWDNNSGSGAGSGPYRTEEVRGWMDKLSIRKHYRMFEGLQAIE